jgi:hypothetical protein
MMEDCQNCHNRVIAKIEESSWEKITAILAIFAILAICGAGTY